MFFYFYIFLVEAEREETHHLFMQNSETIQVIISMVVIEHIEDSI